MFIPKAADVEQLYAELRFLAGNTRAAIDALVATWYLEFRVRTSRTYSQWIDPALHEIAAALVFGADARPGCARLGTTRALAGFSEAEVRDDLASLAQTVATDPTLTPPPADELLAATLAGWHTAAGPRSRGPGPAVELAGVAQLRRLLAHLVAEDSDPGPIVVVADVGAGPHPGAPVDVASVLDRVEAAGPGPFGVGWFELTADSRYGAVTRRTRQVSQALAVFRGALRVVPEFADRPVHVWTEPVPHAAAALPAFVGGLTGGAETRHRPEVRPVRPHPEAARSKRARGHERTRHPRSTGRPERWLASAAALVLIVLAVGTLGVESPSDGGRDTPGADAPQSVVPRPPAPGDHALAAPPVGGVTGTPVDGGSASVPAPPPTPIEAAPIAHREPATPPPPPPSSPEPPTPAPASSPPPSAPETAPAPGSSVPEAPQAAPGSSSGPGPPPHALSNMPDHAPPKSAGHPSSRARITRM